MSKAKRMQIFVEELKRLGYEPHFDIDGDVYFMFPESKSNPELICYILIDEDDEDYALLGHFYFWPLESQQELHSALSIASIINQRFKALKIYAPDFNSVSATVEMLGTPEQIASTLERAIQILTMGVTSFSINMVTTAFISRPVD